MGQPEREAKVREVLRRRRRRQDAAHARIRIARRASATPSRSISPGPASARPHRFFPASSRPRSGAGPASARRPPGLVARHPCASTAPRSATSNLHPALARPPPGLGPTSPRPPPKLLPASPRPRPGRGPAGSRARPARSRLPPGRAKHPQNITRASRPSRASARTLDLESTRRPACEQKSCFSCRLRRSARPAVAAAADAGPAAPTRFASTRPGEIVVPVTVGAMGPFRFLLDTGSTHTAVTREAGDRGRRRARGADGDARRRRERRAVSSSRCRPWSSTACRPTG